MPPDSRIAVAFGVAYPIGVVGVILFVKIAPRLLKRLGLGDSEVGDFDEDGPIVRILVEVANPGVIGKRPRDVSIISHANCQISRVLVDDRFQPIPSDFSLQLKQKLLLVGARNRLAEVVEVLGQRCEEINYTLDLERQRRRVVATSDQLIGQSLEKLHLLSRFGVTITRITRQDIEFVPSPQDRILYGDAMYAVGEPEGLDRFVAFAGHRERTLDETDLMSLAFGLLLGVLAGRVELTLAGKSVSLGLAGGPLLVGLFLGHCGQIGPFIARIPRAGRLLLGELGLALFLGQAGAAAGATIVPVLAEHGPVLCLAAIVLVTVPLLTGLAAARFLLGINALEMFGAICGAMTSTPGLGAATANSDSSLPATSYATVYPLALVLITIVAPLLIALVG